MEGKVKAPLKLAVEAGGLMVIAEPGSELQEIFGRGNGGVILKLIGIRKAVTGARARSAAGEGAQDGDRRR